MGLNLLSGVASLPTFYYELSRHGCSVTASFSGAAACRSLMGCWCYLAACSVATSLPAWLLARVSWDAALQHALS